MVGRAKRVGRDQRRAGAGEDDDTMDARGLKGFGQGHRWQDGGQPARQHRLPHPRWTEEEDVGVTMPASPLPWGRHPSRVAAVDVEVRRLLHQCLGLSQVGGVKAFGEPAVDGLDQVSGFIPFALLLPQRV